jgi:hypothetical protein
MVAFIVHSPGCGLVVLMTGSAGDPDLSDACEVLGGSLHIPTYHIKAKLRAGVNLFG